MRTGSLFLLSTLFMLSHAAGAAEVLKVRLPNGALQPRAADLRDGATAVVYLQGDPKAATVKLTTLAAAGGLEGEAELSTAASQAVALGTVRGPAIACGAAKTRHVLWHGKAGTAADGKGSALFYARADGDGKTTAPQDMMGTTMALDGGAAAAADAKGNVWLVWHALPQSGKGEAARRLYMRRSHDNGRTFSEPWPVKGENQGICGCCGLAAALAEDGTLHVLYRKAENGSERGVRLIRLPADATADTTPTVIPDDRWKMPGCPMTTAAFLPGKEGPAPAWVTEYHLSFGSWKPEVGTSKAPRNHPRMARNAAGETLLAWTEGTGWGKGGELVVQMFSAAGAPQGQPLRAKLPAWTYGACAVLADGRLVLLY